MLPIATLRTGRTELSRPLQIVRALVIVLVVSDLVSAPQVPAPQPWGYALPIASAFASIVALFRPGLGVLLALLPIGSTLVVGPWGQDFMPLLVTTVMICVIGSRWWVAWTLGLYLAYVLAVARLDTGERALTCLSAIVVAALGGFIVRGVVAQARRRDLSIERVRVQTVLLRATERRALADELSQLLKDALAGQGLTQSRAAGSNDPAELRLALAQAEVNAVDTLAQLRGLVSTLRGRGDIAARVDAGAPGLLNLVEEAEDLLVGNGHPVEVELPESIEVAGDLVPRLLGQILREAAPLMARQGAPGQPCRIEVTVEPEVVRVLLSHPCERVDDTPAGLLAAGERVIAAGGTFGIVQSAGRWSLAVSLPLLSQAVAESAPDRGASAVAVKPARMRAVGALVLLIAGAAALGVAVQDPLNGHAGGAWWGLWALLLLACGLATWLRSLPVAVTGLAAVSLIAAWTIDATQVIGQPNQVAIMVLMAIAVGRDSRAAWAIPPYWIGCCLLWAGGFQLGFVTPQLLHVVLGLMLGLVIAFFRNLRAVQRDRLLAVTSTHEEAQGEVRRELAGELHDIVAHQLSLITLQAGAHRHDTELVTLRGALDQVASITRSAQADLALLLHVMRSSSSAADDASAVWLAPRPAAEAAARTLREAGHGVALDVDESVEGLDPTTRKTLTRLIREGTTNVLRYAPSGSSCTLRVRREGAEVRFEMTNPVAERSVRSRHSTGLGLVGLDERVRITGGRLTAGTFEGRWRLDVTLPATPAVDLRPAPT